LLPHSLCRSTTANAPANETSRATVTANAHSLGRYGQQQKKKEERLLNDLGAKTQQVEMTPRRVEDCTNENYKKQGEIIY